MNEEIKNLNCIRCQKSQQERNESGKTRTKVATHFTSIHYGGGEREMKTTNDLKELLGSINTEVAEKRAEQEAAHAAERKEHIGVVMQLLQLATASAKAAAEVRSQMYSTPEVKAAVRGWLRNEFLGFSGPFLPHTAAQIAAAIKELDEVSAEKFAEIRKKNEAVYDHKKAAHAGAWKHGCSECTLIFVQDSKAEGVLHRYIALTTWAGKLLKERYDRNRLPLLPKGQVGPIGRAMDEALDKGEKPGGSGEDLLGDRADKGGKDGNKDRPSVVEEGGPKPKGRRSKSRGGAKNSTRQALDLVEQQ